LTISDRSHTMFRFSPPLVGSYLVGPFVKQSKTGEPVKRLVLLIAAFCLPLSAAKSSRMRLASFAMRDIRFFLLLFATSAWAGDDKDCPIAVKVVETDAIITKVDGTRTTTNCTVAPGGDQINCDSRQIPGSTHTDLISVAEASDGKTYVIQCMLGGGQSI